MDEALVRIEEHEKGCRAFRGLSVTVVLLLTSTIGWLVVQSQVQMVRQERLLERIQILQEMVAEVRGDVRAIQQGRVR